MPNKPKPLQAIPVDGIQAYLDAIAQQKGNTITLKFPPELKRRIKVCAAYYDLSAQQYLLIILHQFHAFNALNFDRRAFEEQRAKALEGEPEFSAFTGRHPADQVSDFFEERLRDREAVEDFFFEEP